VPLWGKFGITLFAGAGSVANTISDFKYSKIKFAAGFGIRYMLVESEKFNIRIDYGMGNDSAELYLAVGEAF
jgi:outer membrane translocation and assembly module TamA